MLILAFTVILLYNGVGICRRCCIKFSGGNGSHELSKGVYFFHRYFVQFVHFKFMIFFYWLFKHSYLNFCYKHIMCRVKYWHYVKWKMVMSLEVLQVYFHFNTCILLLYLLFIEYIHMYSLFTLSGVTRRARSSGEIIWFDNDGEVNREWRWPNWSCPSSICIFLLVFL